jgi:spore germination cell wall hydrolase CwlJ-like protein
VLHRYKYLLVLLLVVFFPARAEYDIEVLCLAQNIYYETRSQPIIEKIAISQVVLNRVSSNKYPSTICEVVYQTVRRGQSIVRDKCQFSWYCDGKSDYPRNSNAWAESIRIAALAMTLKVDFTEGALNYHAVYVSPLWAEDMQATIRIGSHRFYK